MIIIAEGLEPRVLLAGVVVRNLGVATSAFPTDPLGPVVGNQVYLPGTTLLEGKELWTSNGALAGTRVVKDAVAGPASGLASNSIAAISASNVIFAVENAAGDQVWRTDGTTAGSASIRSFAGCDVVPFIAWAGFAYLAITNNSTGQNELWRTDGTNVGTIKLADNVSSPSFPAGFEDQVAFSGWDGTNWRVWMSDGSAAGTRILSNAGGSEQPHGFSAIGNRLFFFNGTFSHMWIRSTDGSGATSSPAVDLGVGTVPFGSTVLNGKMYFAKDTSSAGREVWVSDGTQAGTQLLKDVRTGTASSSPFLFTTVGDQVFFCANDGANGWELWKTDGTSGGTQLVKDINPGAAHGMNNDESIGAAVGDKFFFTAYTDATNFELWSSDGTPENTSMVQEIRPGTSSSSLRAFTGAADRLFFSGSADGLSNTLWVAIDDATAPNVIATTFLPDLLGPQSLRFAFDEALAASSISAGDLVLHNLTTGATVPAGSILATYDVISNSAVFAFPGFVGGALPAGSYRATLPAGAVMDDVGNPSASSAVFNFIWAGGTVGDDQLRVQLNPAGDTVQVYQNSASPTYTATLATLGAIALTGGNGSDAITIDLANGNPVPPMGEVKVDGGGLIGSDQLIVLGTVSADVINIDATIVRIGARPITYAQIENVRLDGRGGFDDVTIAASATPIAFQNAQRLQSLVLTSGARASMLAGGANTLLVRNLSLAPDATLDLNDNDLIVDYTSAPSPLAGVANQIRTARANGTWSGFGITSTAAKNASPKNKTLGAIESADFKNIYGPSALFAGESIDATAVLVKFTYYGDADFNGQVNFDDYARIDNGFATNKTGWLNGDFDLSGGVNFDDYSLIDLAFNTQGGDPRRVIALGAGRPRR